MLGEDRFPQIEELFAPRLRAAVSADTLRTQWTAQLTRTGPVSSIGQPVGTSAQEGLTRVTVPVTCERGALNVIMSVDGDGLLHGLRLAPSADTTWQPPPYAVPRRFTEQQVMLDGEPLAVPGTLTLPHGRRRHPGVVLLGGGGPFDRDGTSGVSKPLKDLAWGLASRGVAVARFDKVGFAHSDVVGEPGFTMTREYVPHAVAAARLLRQQPTVDPARVFVLGHSLGGRVAPRIAAAEPLIAGMVILAGDTQPMHHSAVRVARHLAAANPDSVPGAALESLVRQATRIDRAEFTAATPASELLFGWPASYWMDLLHDDPVATAASLDRPMLILQGGRDYQVTLADDLPRWQAALAHRPDVSIHVFPADDHLFFPDEEPSTPAGNEPPQHVDPAVVALITDWLAPRRRTFFRRSRPRRDSR
jgi:dienelactone hydrolase